jgi:DNA-binding GntR family transcriptional regulator
VSSVDRATGSSRPAGALPLAPTERKSLGDDVSDRIREAILQGHFAPNEHLREERLASLLDVSRGPVREALLQLEREGLVVRRPARGTVVASMSRQDLEEVYSLRSALEGLAVRWAVRNAKEKDLQRLEEAVEQIRSGLGPGVSVQTAARVDLGFHDRLFETAHHKRLARSWAELRPQVHLFLLSRSYVGSKGFRSLMVESHENIVEGIRARDADRAAAIVEEHVRTSFLRVAEGYDTRPPDQGESGQKVPSRLPEPTG